MPPKKKVKEDDVVRIDANKHASMLKAIEEAQKKTEIESMEEESEESLGEEEESSEENEYEEDSFDVEPAMEVGRIDLSFPETAEYEDSSQCYPPSYYTLSSKERLLLLYAENFRKQFLTNNVKRRPLVLAVPNECNVQKFVCSTVRPTAFLHIPLIGNVEGCAEFVADFVIYEPLEDLMKLPTRIISPATLLRRRRGNSFEMATLLCSMLIGAGFSAFVVSGVARIEIVLNDQRNVDYPHQIIQIKPEEGTKSEKKDCQKYKLRPLPDLESHLEENMAEMMKEKEEIEQRLREEEEKKQKEELELRAVDRYHYRRTHAWVVIIDNAPWGIKPTEKYVDENGDVIDEPPKARFIEPSTGFICETYCKQYILVDSIWNHTNYYVNKQVYQRIGDIRWDLRNTADWEHLLPGEPPEMRTYPVVSDENLRELEHSIEEEKHLDILRSWVLKLHIGLKEFEERFPKLKKTIRYKGAIHERYSPYLNRDGKVMQLTFFKDDEYEKPEIRWDYFEHRADLLQQIKYTYDTNKVEEAFFESRNDNLKFLEYSSRPNKPKFLYFYSFPRLDSLNYMEVHSDRTVLKYTNRDDRCFYHEFEFRPLGLQLRRVVERYSREPTEQIPAYKDISMRTFQLMQQKISIKFHYARGALTASTIDFTKPPKPDYGQEIIFNPSLVKMYKANQTDPDLTPLETYKLLLDQLKCEEKVKKQFEKIQDEINTILDQRRHEMQYPVLRFSIFDPLRNGAARALRMKQNADLEEYKREVATKPADFLAPYLVAYKNRKLTYEESWAAYNACLFDMKSRFVSLLNDLQRQYEDLTNESKSLARFLNKFENQFNNYDYNRLVQEGREIELNKRMVQQRLTMTHEESQKKYEIVKESLLKDSRLSLKKQQLMQNS